MVGGDRNCRRNLAVEKASATELKAAAAVIVTISPHLVRLARAWCSATSGSQTPRGMPCQNRGLHQGYAWNFSREPVGFGAGCGEAGCKVFCLTDCLPDGR